MANFSVDGLKSAGSELWKGYTYKGTPITQTKVLSPLVKLNNASDAFLKASTTTAKDGALLSAKSPWYIKYANKGPLKYLGQFSNKVGQYTVKGANAVGTKMAANIAKGGLLSKVPFLGKVANGLKGLSKVPGLGVLVTAGTALWGIGKAAGKALKGDFKGAGHTLLKTAGSTLGVAAGVALMCTGVGFIPGLLLSVGAGFAGDWLGKKVADTVFPGADQPKAQANQYTDPFDAKIDALLKDIQTGPAFR